jgi:Zn-dependent membrane protease YugP
MIKELFSFFEGLAVAAGTFKHTVRDAERRAERAINRLKKKLIMGILEAAFFVIGTVILLLGIILFISRFIGIDIVLMAGGALLLYIALLIRLSQK